MNSTGNSDILRFIWSESDNLEGVRLKTSDGSTVVVQNRGMEREPGIFSGAEVWIEGVVKHGDVVFGGSGDGFTSHYTILHVVDTKRDHMLDPDGRRIPQLPLTVPAELERRVKALRSGTSDKYCALYIEEMGGVRKAKLFENLVLQRLERKCGEVMEVFRESNQDWAQTLYIMLFRGLGGSANQKPYMKLASKATYQMVLRERSDLEVVESLLMGTSGILLAGNFYDKYAESLTRHYEHLANKYKIMPMRADEWEKGRSFPSNSVILRLAQAAAMLSGNDFLFDRAMNCRTRKELYDLLCFEASEYWNTHYNLDRTGNPRPKRLGADVADRIGINGIIPVMFSYGNYTGKEDLKEAAIAMYDEIQAEENSIIRDWRGKGIGMQSAFDSQALLQLNNEYCIAGRCTVCPVGKSTIKKGNKSFILQ